MAKGFALALSGGRKRALVTEDTGDETYQNKKRHRLSRNSDHDDDGLSLGSDIEALFSETDDYDDAEEVDDEPEQGDILWSEDQEEYPPCAVYHPDVKKHQVCVTEFAVNITDQLSKVRHEGDDIAKLHTEALACQKFPELKKVVVALVGDAGSGMTSIQNGCGCADFALGKSSLINSILDMPHIARKVCTKIFLTESSRLIHGSRATTVAHAHVP
jgi:hypothetical protein